MMEAPAGDTALLLHAYLDGELDPADALAVERQMARDPALAAEYERLKALQQLMRDRLPPEPLPPGLRARIETYAGEPHSGPSWRALAASVAVAAVLASGSTWMATGPQTQGVIQEAVVAGHIRALMSSQPADVLSSDQHTVKPWFNGRIPQAPRVVDLAKLDFPLVGGRLDVIGRKPVPTLVYRHRKHMIGLTAVAATLKDSLPASRVVDGYNIVQWTEGAVSYWAISDLDAADMDRFVQAFRAGTPEP